jgi:hypothetical protein
MPAVESITMLVQLPGTREPTMSLRAPRGAATSQRDSSLVTDCGRRTRELLPDRDTGIFGGRRNSDEASRTKVTSLKGLLSA